MARPDKDYVRSTLRVLKLQLVLALVMVIGLPYIFTYKILDSLVRDIYTMAGGNAELILQEYQRFPDPQAAQALASRYRVLIAFEGADRHWYTDGEAIHVLQDGMERPYYNSGLRQRLALGPDEWLVVSWPSGFFVPDTHIRVFLSWLGAPLLLLLFLYFMLRRSLQPITWMQTGIRQVSAGDFDYTAPDKGRAKDIVARKFNDMTQSIREVLRSKDQLIMDLSHELRSPLTRIKVAMALLPESENRQTVEKNIRELESIITTILETQRINLRDIDLHLQPCRLAALVREVSEVHHRRPPGITLLTLDDSLQPEADAALLKLLLHNLLDNAIKYSKPDSAAVQVSLTRTTDTGSNQLVCLLEVLDNGIGLAEADLTRVFEPFYKVAPERGFNSGYGLGLGLCKRIAELHGGSIRLVNNSEGGLRVLVTLPL